MRVPRIRLAAAAVGRIVALRESHFSVNTPPIPRTIATADILSVNKATNQLIDCRPMLYFNHIPIEHLTAQRNTYSDA
uniref:Uncharacterized protein n=1 Tax=Glossina palpalis gambiensis TaxID=67801 RepID=A0A1B0B0F1_9MUSC